MSQSITRQIHNSLAQVANGLGTAALNFLVVLVYAWQLGPETFGRFITSQAQVLVWILLVDLGITSGLMGTLQRETTPHRQVLKQVLQLRISAAFAGTAAIALISWLSSGDKDTLLQDLAFTPHLFAYGLQYTMTSYLTYRGRLPLSVLANLIGIVIANALTIFLAYQGASVTTLLLAQSWGGILAALIMRLSIDIPKDPSNSNNANALKSIWAHAWPNFIMMGTMVLWSRLDQVFAARWLGFETSGQYGFAIRLVAIPTLALTSVTFSLFSDLHRVGRDAPEKLAAFSGLASKVLFRYGAFFSAGVLLIVGAVVLPLVPNFEPAIQWLPWFIPGIWCYAIYSILVGSLSGFQKYKDILKIHLYSLAIYLVTLPLLTLKFGIFGMIGAYNLFAVLLAILCYRSLVTNGILPSHHRIWGKYSRDESEFLIRIRSKILRKRAGITS